jgi:hypothetical protein
MKKKYLLIMITSILCLSVRSQSELSFSDSDLHYGIAAKLSLEIGPRFSSRGKKIKNRFFSPAYKLSISSGIGYESKSSISVFPTIHTGILFFNKGSIGADQSKNAKRIQHHFFVNGIVTIELDKRDFSYQKRSVPFYHFSEFTANPLQNPYKSSISYGANLIFVQNKKSQRIGFLNLNIAGRAQISYYNDGGPVLKIAGDKRDRYYTGGIIISYHGNNEDLINLIELSYHKYTGYQEYAFDVADKLQIDFLNYNDENQFSFNQQRWRLNFSNINNGFGGSISLYNRNNLDLQDFLHFNTNVPYHPDYYRGYRWMFGGRYEYNNVTVSK